MGVSYYGYCILGLRASELIETKDVVTTRVKYHQDTCKPYNFETKAVVHKLFGKELSFDDEDEFEDEVKAFGLDAVFATNATDIDGKVINLAQVFVGLRLTKTINDFESFDLLELHGKRGRLEHLLETHGKRLLVGKLRIWNVLYCSV